MAMPVMLIFDRRILQAAAGCDTAVMLTSHTAQRGHASIRGRLCQVLEQRRRCALVDAAHAVDEHLVRRLHAVVVLLRLLAAAIRELAGAP